MHDPLRVVILKPSKYARDGYLDRFRWGFMPNSTLPYIRSMTPDHVNGTPIEVHVVDEYVHTNLEYLSLLRGRRTLLAVVGVQSHQFHRALDLAARAVKNGCMAIIGGPHVMTCDTSMLHGRGVSFAVAEAELTWHAILEDATRGELEPVYGSDRRWQQELDAPVIVPPSPADLRRYVIPMLGLYPARGCPFVCNFCSVIKIAGRRIRSQSIDTTIASLRAAKAAGVRMIFFTSDNFNKYPDVEELLHAMIEEQLDLGFFVQCDTQVANQPELVALLGQAGCFQIFVGVESFNRQTLLAAKKGQNRPQTYLKIVELCREHGMSSHFSNIIGFPQDDAQQIQEHVEILREISPTWASFYILCPIPGTEQYDEFLADGLITETNLDRFDTVSLTWRHPHLGADQLFRSLFDCYRQFFSLRRVASNLRPRRLKSGRLVTDAISSLGYSAFHRYCASRRFHPSSGGVMRLTVDKAEDYRDLRRDTFGFDLAPLPRSLQLPAAEAKLNRLVKPRARRAGLSSPSSD